MAPPSFVASIRRAHRHNVATLRRAPLAELSHALLELLQRDGNGLVFRALDRGDVVDLDGLQDAAALDALRRLRAAGLDPVVKLASTDLGLTNVYAVADDPAPGGDDDDEFGVHDTGRLLRGLAEQARAQEELLEQLRRTYGLAVFG